MVVKRYIEVEGSNIHAFLDKGNIEPVYATAHSYARSGEMGIESIWVYNSPQGSTIVVRQDNVDPLSLDIETRALKAGPQKRTFDIAGTNETISEVLSGLIEKGVRLEERITKP